MSRFRLYPTPAQEVLLLGQCGHARYVWNLGLEQRLRWRRRGMHEGFRIVGAQALRVRRTRDLPDWRSSRVRRDRAGRWHLAFTAIPEPVPAPRTGEVVGVDRGVRAAVALSTGELSSPAGLRPKETESARSAKREPQRARPPKVA